MAKLSPTDKSETRFTIFIVLVFSILVLISTIKSRG